jgi:phospholipid/cholesterol/gamma-HCH transport system substrate-binding protein
MRRSTLEIVMGLVVLAGAIGFTFLVYQVADLKTANGYEIGADFGTTGGLVVGDDVRLSGIKVGRIVSQSLDPVTYTARITMQIDNTVQLPEDSTARITAASLLGGNFLEIMPGTSDQLMAEGSIIYDTRDPVSLSDLLGKFVFQNNDNGNP